MKAEEEKERSVREVEVGEAQGPPRGPRPPGGQGIGESRPDPEVAERPVRRRFTVEFKRRVLAEADRCSRPGEVGALLRRHGLYSSHLVMWRRLREEGTQAGLAPKKRGRKPEPKNPLADRVAQLEREKAALENRLLQAQAIIEFQKKISELLGIPLKQPGSEGSDS